MTNPTDEQYRQAARDDWASDDLEIDEGAPVERNDEQGAWVQAWVYVNSEEVVVAD